MIDHGIIAPGYAGGKRHARAPLPVRLTRLAVAVPLALAGMPSGAMAQQVTAGTQAPSQPAAATQLAPVVVRGVSDATTQDTGAYTATGVSGLSSGLGLTLRETPQSVSVITEQRMRDQNLTQLTDVANQTAGLTVSEGGNVGSDSSQIYSRGFAIDTYMIDGVRLVSPYTSIFQSQDMALYDRVEIVRGPAGLMNGVGSPAGAINMIRKKPTRDFRGEVTLEAGSWNLRRGVADISTPLNASGSVRGRVVAALQDGDSFIDRFQDRRKVFYGIVEADVAERTRVRAGMSHQRMDLTGNARGGMPAYATDGQRIFWDRSDSAAASWAYSRRHATTAFVEADHQLANDWELKASVSRIITHSDEVVGYLGGVPNRLTGAGTQIWATRWEYKPQQDVANLGANGTFTLFGREHDAAFGATMSRVNYTSPSYTDWSHTGWVGSIPNVYTWDGSNPVRPPNPSIGTHGTDERNQGVYGSLRLRPADGLSVIVGSRYLDWRRSTSTYRYATGLSTDTRRTEHEIVPYAAVSYDLTRNWTAYTSYTKIFQPQNFKTLDGAYIDPLSGDNYEAGLKGEFLDGRLNVATAVYQVKENNKAIAIPDTFAPDGSQAYEAKSGTRTRGFEVEVAGQLAPAWEVAASYAYNRTVDANSVRINTGIPTSIAKLYTTYRLSGAAQGLTVGGGLRWQSQIYNERLGPNRDQRFTQPAYMVADLLARYDINRNVSASLNVHNLFDKHYYATAGNSYYGAPRSVIVSVTARY